VAFNKNTFALSWLRDHRKTATPKNKLSATNLKSNRLEQSPSPPGVAATDRGAGSDLRAYSARTVCMIKPNPALFGPLKRIEEASRRCAGIITTGIERTLHDHPMVIVEIQEMDRALDEFKAAVERGETGATYPEE
jgi:hypothetical protein